MSHLRDRRAFGNIGTRKFRGARFGDALSPRFEGLLDTYSGAAAAYSLRVLTRNWLAGDVVEVRRVNTPATASFTANQITNGELATWSLSGDAFVSTWYDQSGNAKDAVQATTTNQPKIVSSGSLITGGISFDGTNDVFSVGSDLGMFKNIGNANIFTVGQFNLSSTGNEAFISAQAGSGGGRIFLGALGDNASAGGRRLDSDSFVQSTESKLTGEKLYTGNYNWSGGNVTLRINGSNKTSTNFSSGSGNTENTDSDSILIGQITGGTGFLNGKIEELIVYNTNQSSNVSGIETNINAAYSIY